MSCVVCEAYSVETQRSIDRAGERNRQERERIRAAEADGRSPMEQLRDIPFPVRRDAAATDL